MIVLLTFAGIYFSINTRFFQVRRFPYVLKNTIFSLKKNRQKAQDKNRISPFQALTTALASTIGTGNIIGVATALIMGGAGAVFWMWVSAFIGMIIAFAENVINIKFRYTDKEGKMHGGTMVYLKKAFNSAPIAGKCCAMMFAVFCMISAFGTGNMVQINSIASAADSKFNVPPLITGLVVSAISFVIIVGGISRIGSITEKLVPAMTIIYISGCLYVIIANYDMIIPSLLTIIKSAWGFDSAVGGFSGMALAKTISIGFQRGLSSNEAGLGTAPLIYASSEVESALKQGMWSIFQVFFDTVVICTLTAFTILTSGAYNKMLSSSVKSFEPYKLVESSFSSVMSDNIASLLLSICIILFSFTTIIGWCCCGEKAVEYVFSGKSIPVFRVLYVLFTIVGAVTSPELAWVIASNLNGLMALPNILGIITLSDVVKKTATVV